LESLSPSLDGDFNGSQKHLLVFFLLLQEGGLAFSDEFLVIFPLFGFEGHKSPPHQFISHGNEVLESVRENNPTQFVEASLGEAAVYLFLDGA
jgi:hypothetical protein